MQRVPRTNESCHTYKCSVCHVRMSHVTHINAACVTYEWVISHTWMQRVSRTNESYHTYKCSVCHVCECVVSRTWMSHVTHMNETTGWRRLIGSPKLQIIFHKTATKYRALLLKMTYKDKGSYESSPPCIAALSRVPEWMSHVTHMNESCHTYERVMSHIWMSHITHTNVTSLCSLECLNGWVMSHIWMSPVTHMNE